MTEEDEDFNFDIKSPPINPLNKRPIDSWYRSLQIWTNIFGDLATTANESRAELVGAYLMDEVELLALFGSLQKGISLRKTSRTTSMSSLKSTGCGVCRITILKAEDGVKAHSRAHFATLKCLLTDGNGFITIGHNSAGDQITVHVDRSRIISDGKPALGRMLLWLDVYRATTDVKSCRGYYEDLSRVDGPYLEWRRIVVAKKQPEWVFVHSNTFLVGGEVILKSYDATPQGVIQGWADRNL